MKALVFHGRTIELVDVLRDSRMPERIRSHTGRTLAIKVTTNEDGYDSFILKMQRYGMESTEECIMVDSDSLMPIKKVQQVLSQISYSPALWDGIVELGRLTKHFHPKQGFDFSKVMRFLVPLAIGIGAIVATLVVIRYAG